MTWLLRRVFNMLTYYVKVSKEEEEEESNILTSKKWNELRRMKIKGNEVKRSTIKGWMIL